MAVTISQIAERAGVSAGTVSRILNGKNKENRPAIARRGQRVRQIAAELGYTPNLAARSIVTGQFRTAGLLTCGEIGFDWLPAQMLHGACDGFRGEGWRTTMHEVDSAGFANPDFVPDVLRESAIDGLLIHGTAGLTEGSETLNMQRAAEFFTSHRLPSVWLNMKHQRLMCVRPDDEQGGRFAGSFLLDKGRERIAYYRSARSFHSVPHFSEVDRERGLHQELASREMTAAAWYERVNSIELGQAQVDGARDFLRRNPKLDGIVCYEMRDAIPLYVAAAALGRDVPNELEIVAFHDELVHDQAAVPIATIYIPFREVGRRAALLLLDLVRGDHPADLPPTEVVVPYSSVRVPRDYPDALEIDGRYKFS